ncbi:MAG: hypothetical protein ABI981_04925 [Betaproteobacteria bacterium]
MKTMLRCCFAFALAVAAGAATAEFHTYQIEQIYTNASGTTQYIVMHESQGLAAEQFWNGNTLTSTAQGSVKTYVFPNNLPVGMGCPYNYCVRAAVSSTANTRVLIATQAFASLGLIAPDFVVPNNFLSTSGGTLNYAGVDQITYGPLPTDGATAVNRTGAAVPAVASNFSGQSVSVKSAAPNYEGLWWAGAAESGWGINFAHQADVIFATWFTYDATGKAWWLTMTANKSAEGVYAGAVIQTTGAPFNAYVAPATATTIGNATITFTSGTAATFNYTVNGITQSKALVLQTFGPVPTCTWGTQPDLTQATHFQDLWWAAAGSESGWGVNLAQQGTNIFATWFTYDAARNPLWYSVSAVQTAPKVFSGPLIKTSGPAFSAVPFDGNLVQRTTVGTASFSFTNGNAGTFAYQVNDGTNVASQSKVIERQVFRAPGTACQ